MAAHQFNRRSSDQAEQTEIESLIAAEDDPKMRLQLMIMNRINLSLIANTHTINEIATKLENHLSLYEQRTAAEQALLNKGKGAWRVVAWVIGAVQVIGLGIWADARSDLASIHTALEQSRTSDVRMEQRLTALEQKK